jgi:hypothetical protein
MPPPENSATSDRARAASRRRRAISRLACLAAFAVLASKPQRTSATALALPRPQPGPGRWARTLAAAPCVREGRHGEALSVFFDPCCPVCLLLYRASRPALHEGSLRLQWIPVAILSGASMALGRWLLDASDPRGALARIWSFDASALTSIGQDPAARDLRILANTQLLRALAAQWVPAGQPVRTPSLVSIDVRAGMRFQSGLSAELLARLGRP